MGNRSSLLLMLALLGCTGKTNLSECWDDTAFRASTEVTGQAIALYNPDGPLLITSLRCRNAGQLVAIFPTQSDEDRIIDEMAKMSKRRWFGGEAYVVSITGNVGEDSKEFRGKEINIKEIKILGLASDPVGDRTASKGQAR